MKFEQVAELPKFDTGQYEGCEFSISGGDAKLTIRFAELPPFEINFLSRALASVHGFAEL